MAPGNTMHSALNYSAANWTINHLNLNHIATAAPHHLHHTLCWQRPLCWPHYCFEDAVWQLESFRWVGIEFSKPEREFLSWTPSTWIFLSGLDASKVTPHHFSLKLEFARQRYIYDLLQTFIVHYIKKPITIFSIYHTTPKILFSTDHITITCINLWNI